MASSYWSPEQGERGTSGSTSGRETVVAAVAEARDPLIGRVLRERFVLEEVIGRGGMGTVYRARDLRREEARDRRSFIAIKVLSDVVKRYADTLVALQREAKRAQLLAHPNIATVYDFDREGDLAYLCMELLTGRGLNELLRGSTRRGMDFDRALPIIQGMARGLAYAHQRGIVHADFKPENVFFTDEGFVKILDFGIARVLPKPDQTTDTQFDGARLGALTPAYASCEMFQNLETDPRDDIYALACVSYELLAGTHPYYRLAAPEARDRQIAVKPVRGLTRSQNRALRRGLAFDREQRIASADQFLEELAPRRSGVALGAALSILGVLSLAGAAGVASWLLTRTALQPADVQGTAQPAAGPAGSDLGDPRPGDPRPVPVDRPTQEKIGRILEMADLHLAMGRLTEPPGSNAAEAYAAVDALQPGNGLARAGLMAVSSRLETQAREAAQQGHRSEALRILAAGLEWTPEHPGLVALRSELSE